MVFANDIFLNNQLFRPHWQQLKMTGVGPLAPVQNSVLFEANAM